MKEDILQFVWQHKLLKPAPLVTVSGKQLQIIKPGELNKDSGPDFFNAKIKIDDLIFAGNVEVHVKSSDWLSHNHQQDRNYDNLVLHVVYEHNKELNQITENNVEVLEIKNLVPQELLINYESLINSKTSIPCETQLSGVNEFKFNSWMERMLVERLEYKMARFQNLLDRYEGNYSHVLYVTLLRNFGFKVNAAPFELLAHTLPLQLLLKYSDHLPHLEALLLGTAGFLDDQFQDKHLRSIQNEFEFLRNKHGLVPLDKKIFKFSRLRPANFPTLRLAQFASLIHNNTQLFSAPYSFDSYHKLTRALEVDLNGYWKNHYSLDGAKTVHDLKFGTDSLTNLIINTFAPFFFFYGRKSGKAEYETTATHLLEGGAFENNAKTRLFAKKKEHLQSAAHSQALIHLFDNYCTPKKCLHCGIAASILQSR